MYVSLPYRKWRITVWDIDTAPSCAGWTGGKRAWHDLQTTELFSKQRERADHSEAVSDIITVCVQPLWCCDVAGHSNVVVGNHCHVMMYNFTISHYLIVTTGLKPLNYVTLIIVKCGDYYTKALESLISPVPQLTLGPLISYMCVDTENYML